MIRASAVLKEANIAYGKKKLDAAGKDWRYVTPEAWPTIQSKQVLCLLEALVEAINLQEDER